MTFYIAAAEIPPTFIEQLTAWSTFAAAIATGVSAGIIAWQSVQTRRSVQVTEEALSLTRAEFDRNTSLIDDNLKARIDAEMPRISTGIGGQSARVWDPKVTTNVFGQDEPAAIQAGTEYIVPRDNGVLLGVSVSVWAANDGPRRAQCISNGAVGPAREILLNPGDPPHGFQINRVETLEQWIRLAMPYLPEEQRSGVVLEDTTANIGSLVFMYPGDVGAREVHQFAQGGSIVEPVPGNAGAWRIVSLPGEESQSIRLHAVVMPFERNYFRSRMGEDRLA